MKIKKSQLETLIKEELNSLDEVSLSQLKAGASAGLKGLGSSIKNAVGAQVNKASTAFTNAGAAEQKQQAKKNLTVGLEKVKTKTKELLDVALSVDSISKNLSDKFQDGTTRPFDISSLLDSIYRVNSVVEQIKKDLEVGHLAEKKGSDS